MHSPQGAGHVHLLWRGVLHRLHCQHPLWRGPPQAAGDNLLHHGLLQELQRSVCSSYWSTSCLSFSTGLRVCRVVSLTFFSLLSLTAAVHQFSLFLTCVMTEVPPVLLKRLALAAVGPSWSWLKLAVSNTGAAPGPFSQTPLQQLPH